MNVDHLLTIAAIAETGSFDGAAQRLHVSTSAVSQRVKALERELGQVLIVRGSPSTPTSAGDAVVRCARQVDHLVRAMRSELGETLGVTEVGVAVNADSMATWFPAVFADLADHPDVRLVVQVDDEAHTAQWLRSGAVLAAVSTDAHPAPGCRVMRLGSLAYVPRVHPALLGAHGVGGGPDLLALPVVRFDEKDTLQDDALRDAGIVDPVPGPRVAGSAAFALAVGAGLGWGMIPVNQLHLVPGTVPVPGIAPRTRSLYWHRWALDTPALRVVTQAVVEAAGVLEG